MILETSLSMLGGYLVRMLPSAISGIGEIVKLRLHNQHELAMQTLNIEAVRLRESNKLKRIEAELALEHDKRNNEFYLAERTLQGSPNGISIPWIECLNASVRPVLTYALVFIYLYLKLSMVQALPDVPTFMVYEAYLPLWSEHDQVLLSAVIGYFFGNRTLEKMQRH